MVLGQRIGRGREEIGQEVGGEEEALFERLMSIQSLIHSHNPTRTRIPRLQPRLQPRLRPRQTESVSESVSVSEA